MSEQGIAPTLIVARVASGEARPDDSWRNSEEVTGGLSALRFDGSDEESTGTYEMHNDGLPTPVTMNSATGNSDLSKTQTTIVSYHSTEKKRTTISENEKV